MLRKFIEFCGRNFRRRRFRVGVTLSHFVARDIRRDVKIVDASEVDQGFVNARVRTWNVLYASNGIAPVPNFGDPERIRIKNMWDWQGPTWGGPVPHEGPKSKA